MEFYLESRRMAKLIVEVEEREAARRLAKVEHGDKDYRDALVERVVEWDTDPIYFYYDDSPLVFHDAEVRAARPKRGTRWIAFFFPLF